MSGQKHKFGVVRSFGLLGHFYSAGFRRTTGLKGQRKVIQTVGVLRQRPEGGSGFL